ncbi:hypothetical protein ABZR86_01970 [Dyella marensis]|uniref:hypothetical protein n=1 Tax=Dyella TaxID=231454 RepID=UPI001160DBF7|nr:MULTISPECIES: hypothetical protein [Dyella]
MSGSNRFRLVGHRFQSISLDESIIRAALKKAGGEIDLTVSIGYSNAGLSDDTFNERPVVELAQRVRVQLPRPTSDEGEHSEVAVISYVAGFVGREKDDDGNLDIFNEDIYDYRRLLFWATRPSAQLILSLSMLRDVVLPWDPAQEKRKSATKPGKPIGNRKRKGS